MIDRIIAPRLSTARELLKDLAPLKNSARRAKSSYFALLILLTLSPADASAQTLSDANSARCEQRADNSTESTTLDITKTTSSKQVSPFVFDEPLNLAKDSFFLHKYELLKWNSSEKEELLEILAAIERRFTLLTKQVKPLGPISIFRVKELRSKIISTEPYLVSGPGYILVSDKFFMAPDKLHALMHELVHLIDSCGEQAYNPKWVNRMLPSMWKSKLTLQFLTGHDYRIFLKSLPQISELPSNYATINFAELLAEVISAKLTEMSEEDFSKFASKWFSDLLHPKKNRIERNSTFMGAMKLYKQENFREATRLLQKTKTPSASTILSNYYLATCLFKTGKIQESLAECNTTLRKAKVLDLMDIDEIELGALITKADILLQMKKYELAKETLNIALHKSPTNRHCLRSRSLCNFELGQEVEGLLDLYRAKGLDKLMYKGIKCGDYCPKMTIELLETATQRTKSVEPLYIKSAAYHRLARKAADKRQRNSYFNSALAALMEASERSETYRAQTHAQCGLICLEMGDLQTARIYFEKALCIDKENIPAILGMAKLLANRGNTQESSKLCKDVRIRLDLLKNEDIVGLSPWSLNLLSKDETLKIVLFPQ